MPSAGSSMRRVIVLGAVEHDDRPFEGVGIVGIGQVARRETPREITLVFMIALSNRLPRSTMKPASCFSGWSNGRMTCSSSIAAPRQLSPMRAAVDGQRVLADQPVRHQLGDHRRHAAGAVVILAEIFARPAAG